MATEEKKGNKEDCLEPVNSCEQNLVSYFGHKKCYYN